MKLKEEANSTPQKKQHYEHVTYQFSYNDNTRQQTDTRNDLCCPWCSLDCGQLYGLLKHLRLCHARFNFLYVVSFEILSELDFKISSAPLLATHIKDRAMPCKSVSSVWHMWTVKSQISLHIPAV